MLLQVAPDEVVRRLVQRGVDEGRSDDSEETIRRRLEVYDRETTPLTEFYQSALIDIDGAGSVEDVFSAVMLALAKS